MNRFVMLVALMLFGCLEAMDNNTEEQKLKDIKNKMKGMLEKEISSKLYNSYTEFQESIYNSKYRIKSRLALFDLVQMQLADKEKRSVLPEIRKIIREDMISQFPAIAEEYKD